MYRSMLPLGKKLSAPKVGFLDGRLLLQCNGNSFYLRKLTTSSTTHNHSGPLHHVTRGLLAGLHCPVRLLLHSLQLQSLSFLLDRQWCDQGGFPSRLPEAGHFHFQELLVRREVVSFHQQTPQPAIVDTEHRELGLEVYL